MNTASSGLYGRQAPSTAPRRPTDNSTDLTSRARLGQNQNDDEQILVHFNGHFDGIFTLPKPSQGRQQWEEDTQSAPRRISTKRNSRLYSARVSRQKSRRRELLGRQVKPGITVDTSFTRHNGSAPHQVFPQDEERSSGPTRKQSWFGGSRSSTKNKGLGITKGTPQPEITHQVKPSIDRNEAMTAVSLTPGTQPWQDISPWDRRIPIGFSVPTESVSEFSSYKAPRQRSGSEVTLVTPSIIITPAAAMQSVWSPDTALTESDYTPSIYSRHPFHSKADVPPVPAIPTEMAKVSGVQLDTKTHSDSRSVPGHTRSDTLDSAGTAFEEEDDDDTRRKHRIMSTGTVFEEDDTPLREKSTEKPLAIDTSILPTPRRSQGWWNVITTPFVMTPNTATWTQNARLGDQTPNVPSVPLLPPSDPATAINIDAKQLERAPVQSTPQTEQVPKPDSNRNAHDATNNTAIAVPANMTFYQSQQTTPIPTRTTTSPLSALSATPIVSTAAMGTVLMPRQVDEQPRQININIELQDRRPFINTQTTGASSQPNKQQTHTFAPALQVKSAGSSTPRSTNSARTLPVFAPPPTIARKGSHFSYDNHSRSSSPGSTPDLKGRKEHRKVCNPMSLLPFGKKKRQQRTDAQKEKKQKKKRGKCFWGCCCCLIFFILLAILIPVVVVLTRKHHNTSTTTPPGQDVGSQWLNLTNYPPIPTGILTIAQPEAVEEESGCVAPTTLWSCALPKEIQDSVKPNKPDQPNFKIQITFENGTAASLPKAQRTKRVANPVSAGAFIRSRWLHMRSAVSPSPAPPSVTDMAFLGKTTDGNSAPFEGEITPLFITFQDPKSSASRKIKRANPDDPTNITAVIPPPMLSSDGTAAPANLLPFPSAQPLRLFNRGKDNEYFGFYTYFDRSIFLKQINGTNRGGNPADVNGGSSKAAANMRCTYAETRFLVQIWTRSQTSKPLLQNTTSSASAVFKRPGTFPYPVTITIDRHGGNPAKKNLYCYDMESDGTIKDDSSKRFFQFEDRGFGGVLVNGTQGVAGPIKGSIDGGSGGCRCQWQNWLN